VQTHTKNRTNQSNVHITIQHENSWTHHTHPSNITVDWTTFGCPICSAGDRTAYSDLTTSGENDSLFKQSCQIRRVQFYASRSEFPFSQLVSLHRSPIQLLVYNRHLLKRPAETFNCPNVAAFSHQVKFSRINETTGPLGCQRIWIPSISLCLHLVFTQFPLHSDHVLLHHHFVPSPSVCRLYAGERTDQLSVCSQPLLQSQFLNVSNSISLRLSILISPVLSHLVSLPVPIQNGPDSRWRNVVVVCTIRKRSSVCPVVGKLLALPVSDCLF